MKQPRDSIIWGGLLLLIGLAFLLWNLGVLANYQSTIGWVAVALFGGLGVALLVAQVLGPQAWWRVIPGMTLLGIAAVVLLSILQAPPVWIASSVFLAIALAFLIIYFGDRQERWWAFVPFGAMAVMVTVMVLSNAGWPALLVGVALFAGMGLVFLLVYALAKNRRSLSWALVPATALLLMALVALEAHLASASPGLAAGLRFWPALLVILGIVLIGYGITRRTKPLHPVGQLSPQPGPAEAPLAPGAAVLTVPDDTPTSAGTRVERSPITLHDTPQQPATDQELPKDFDIYDVLKSAPPGD